MEIKNTAVSNLRPFFVEQLHLEILSNGLELHSWVELLIR